MIELKNVNKVYKSKKGAKTEALRNISIKFPEKGMVFILGKSGSGKSTLLNVIGGLDNYDNGDIIINGKSTKKFKERDWDSYRNTYIGFIFQEFNLIEDYSVEQNVKLAMELQHKEVSDEEIENILNKVDLLNVSKRRINELSGGQKQRIAIARALIKKPQIVIADEPTGNLDSTTTIQILDILKEISREKLVIIVSHDEESANKYADRIIKIKDGSKILDTNENNEENINTNEFYLKKAVLPFKHSLNLALKSMFTKKISLIFNTIIIAVCFMFLAITLSSNWSNINERILDIINEETNVSIVKYDSEVIVNSEEPKQVQELDDELINEIEQKTGLNWYKQYAIGTLEKSTFEYNQNINLNNIPVYYYINQNIKSYQYIQIENNLKFENLIGNIPVNESEVIIPSYIADCIIYYGASTKNNLNSKTESSNFKPGNYNEIVTSNKYFKLGDNEYVKIVGIIDNTNKLQEYNNLKNETYYDFNVKNNSDEEKQYNNLNSYINSEQIKIYVNVDFINKLNKEKVTFADVSTKLVLNKNSSYTERIKYIDNKLKIYTNNGEEEINKLSGKEIVITDLTLNELYDSEVTVNYYKIYNKNYFDASETERAQYLISFIKNKNIIGNTVNLNIKDGKVLADEYEEYTIKGIVIKNIEFIEVSTSFGISAMEIEDLEIYCSNEIASQFIKNNAQLLKITTKISEKEDMETILKYYPTVNSNIISESVYSEKVMIAYAAAMALGNAFKIITIIFAVFASVLIIDFIQKSVKSSRKKIGTLRALGCRSTDVLKIFLYEGFTIMLLPLIISVIASPILIDKLNKWLIQTELFNVNIFNFSIINILEMILFMIVIVFITNVLLVKKATKMKPIDAILNK